MASNPFDDFAQDFSASLPGQQQQAGAFGAPPTSSGGGAAPFPTTSSGVQQQVPATTVMNQLGQVPNSHQYPGQQPPASASGATSMNGTAVPPVHQQPPPSQQSVIGMNTSATGMYHQQPPAAAHPSFPPQPSSSALVPSAVDAAAPSPYASMLGAPPIGQQPNVATLSTGISNGMAIGAPVPASATGANPFQAGPQAVAAPTPGIDQNNPFAAPPRPGAPLMQTSGAGVAPPSASVPYGTHAAPPTGSGQFDPISVSAVPPAPTSDPFGASVSPASLVAGVGALVPASQPADDPFGVFASPADAVTPIDPTASVTPGVASAPAPSSDPWADMGFGPPIPDSSNVTTEMSSASAAGITQGDPRQATGGAKTSTRTPGELPPGGEWYDARIFTPTLGVMFFKPQELTDSLFLQTDKALVDALDDRPVVAFIVEGSSARSAGVELGHVLLKVNGIDVKNPKEASRLIKEGPRPLPLLFYVPDTTVVVAEGEHMVKYDTRETGAPNSAKDWKPKYVVIGGIIAQPWMMNMYRSKVSRHDEWTSEQFVLNCTFTSLLITNLLSSFHAHAVGI
jgi:hypothetical protein